MGTRWPNGVLLWQKLRITQDVFYPDSEATDKLSPERIRNGQSKPHRNRVS